MAITIPTAIGGNGNDFAIVFTCIVKEPKMHETKMIQAYISASHLIFMPSLIQ